MNTQDDSLKIKLKQLEEENLRLRSELAQKEAHVYLLNEREALINALIQNIPLAFWAFDENNVCFIQNNVSKFLLGDIAGTSVLGNSNPLVSSATAQILHVLSGKDIDYEQEYLNTDGRKYYYHNILSPFEISKENKGILVFNIDISERKLFEKALQESEKKFRRIYNNSTDGLLIHDRTGNIYDYNEEFRSITGWTHKDLLVKVNFFDLIIDDHKELVQKGIHELKNDDQVFVFETEIQDIVGIALPVEIKSKYIDYGENATILTIIRNISLRKRFESKLLNTVVETEEKERTRLAVDLHDEIGPLLSSMKMYLSLIKESTEESKKQYITSHVMELVKQAITSIREISNSLSPHLLTNYGLVAAITSNIQIVKDLLPVKFTNNCDVKRFPNNIEIVYYRIFKELLNNTLKHAEATQVKLALHYEKNVLTLRFEDNGKGFNVLEQMEERKTGLGLFSILSRVKAINGDYFIDSDKGKGVVFELHTKIEQLNL